MAKFWQNESSCVSLAGVTNMRPEKEFRAAREAFRRDQQSWTFFDPLLIFAMRYQKLIARLNYYKVVRPAYSAVTDKVARDGK